MTLSKTFQKSLTTMLAASLPLLIASCGDDKKDDDPPVVVYGNMTLSDSSSGQDNASTQLTAVAACTRNADTGRVDVTISSGANMPTMTLAFKNYSSSPKSYTCTQAADNSTSDTEVGGKFESCMVSASVLSAPGATTLNKYNIYREAITTKKFAYSGVCTVNVTTAIPSIVGTVACAGMVQTNFESTPRNPINDPLKTANLRGDFTCALQ